MDRVQLLKGSYIVNPTISVVAIPQIERSFENYFIEISVRASALRRHFETINLIIRDKNLEKAFCITSSKRNYIKRKIIKEYENGQEFISRIFDEFKIIDSRKIEYGSKKYGNYNICVYGSGDWFKNACWIHCNLIEEYARNYQSYAPLQKEVAEYVAVVNEYYKAVSMNLI